MITEEEARYRANQVYTMHTNEVLGKLLRSAKAGTLDDDIEALLESDVTMGRVTQMCYVMGHPDAELHVKDLRQACIDDNIGEFQEVELVFVVAGQHPDGTRGRHPYVVYIGGIVGDKSGATCPAHIARDWYDHQVVDFVMEQGFTEEEAAQLVPDRGVEMLPTVEREMERKLHSEIDAEVAEFRKEMATKLDDIFGEGGD